MKVFMNELGLYKSEDGHWGIRQVNDHSWVVQYRENANDPWDWGIKSYCRSREDAMMKIDELARRMGVEH